MICANILIYYLLAVTCCCCCCCCCAGSQLAAASPASGSSEAAPITSPLNSQRRQQQQQIIESSSSSSSSNAYLSAELPIEAAAAAAAAASVKKQANNHVHKLMSDQDLRRTFQVDSHDQVPEYEVLKLQVQQDGSHLISPVSDLGELLADHQQSSPQQFEYHHHQQQHYNYNSDDAHHKKRDAASRQKRDLAASGELEAAEVEAEGARARGAISQKQQQQQQHQKAEKKTKKNEATAGADNEAEANKLIVINLSTFGKDFNLRLKRNADFQQRIKGMKMFMAESTQDGQLKYTEVSHPSNGNGNARAASGNGLGKHKQEPHKRAASADEDDNKPEQQQQQQPPLKAAQGDKKVKDKQQQQHQTGGWNIGSTYHDEDNLAALLIDHDKKTGQLQIEGTIGNDFVIKPMPRATIEALESQLAAAAAKAKAKAKAKAAAAAEEDRQKKAAEQQLATAESSNASSRLAKSDDGDANVAAAAAASSSSAESKPPASERSSSGAGNSSDLGRAIHMHDDDPHDDDEMFLDEDEAIELAQLQLANRTTMQQQQQQQLISGASETGAILPQQRQLHLGGADRLAARERKWQKYRKLLAQTQVPKIHKQPSEQQQQHSSSPGGGRTRRRAPGAQPITSHHIVFRQRPSSEESSSEHQHSFMAAPSGSSMERLAFSFERPSAAAEAAAAAADDELGGQFYLEPASVTGFERAGHTDWSFKRRAPYAQLLAAGAANSAGLGPNGTALLLNGTLPVSGQGRRFKRHARQQQQRQQQPPPQVVRRKRQAPDTVWPEVLLVVDYDSFLLHGGDSRDVKRYFVSFWNGVDLRYKLLVHPHIRISLAGMIVAKDRDATPYLERNRLRAPNADAVDAAGALTDMGKYLYREDRLPTYDLAVVITKLDMCRRRFEGGRCNRGTAGFAYVGGACVVNKRLEKVNSVAIIEDSGGFSGIIVAAHEVGHLLGCVHDGSPPPSYLGGPGATHCPWEDGFIMSDLRHTERGFRWSQCSVEQFKHFLNGETATCLYNYPHESQMLHRLLPGTMLSLDEQCKRDRGTNACFKDARVCAQLFCFDSASGYCVSYRPAAEGSPCGEGQVCRNGKCVGEIENIIPDYTHQSQTVVARGRPAAASGHGIGARLVDNGLSASSTSSATSSPDGKPLAVGGGPSAGGTISSRMDTIGGGGGSGGYSSIEPAGYSGSFGGRYGPSSASGAAADSMTSSPAGIVVSRQKLPAPGAATTSSAGLSSKPRGAKLTAPLEPGARQFQLRSGALQAPPRGTSAGAAAAASATGAQSGTAQPKPGSRAASSSASRGLIKQQQAGALVPVHSSSASTGSSRNHQPRQFTSPSGTDQGASLASDVSNSNSNNNLLASSSTDQNLFQLQHQNRHHHPTTKATITSTQHQQQQQTQQAANKQRPAYQQQQQQQPRSNRQPDKGHVNSSSSSSNNNNNSNRKQQIANVNQASNRAHEPSEATIYNSPDLFSALPATAAHHNINHHHHHHHHAASIAVQA